MRGFFLKFIALYNKKCCNIDNETESHLILIIALV